MLFRSPSPGQAPIRAQPIAAAPSVSTNAPAAAPAASAPTNQVAVPATSAASPAKPEAAASVSTNAPAPALSAPAPTNQIAASAASAASQVAGAANSTPSPATLASTQPNTTAPTASVQEGSGLFVSAGCAVCHKIDGKGGAAGPDLSHEVKLGRLPQWLITQITDPIKHNPSTIMPAHKNLTQPQLQGLADFILNPSSGQAALSAGQESKPEKQLSASSAKPAQEEQSKASVSPS